MCGIVGYIGKAEAPTVLINGLRRLEYRGYDSAGIAILDDERLVVTRAAGKVARLSDRAHAEWPAELFQRANIGIAHTRWATHGPPTEVNAHPHLDKSGEIALVHNGIIENYRSLRSRLEGRGHFFYSETDTEVLAHLIGECDKGDIFQAVCDALHQVVGTFGIAVLSAHQPDRIITARRGSPIVIGVGDGETIVASDASAILAHTQRVIYLDDDDIAIVTADSVDVRDLNNIPVTREIAQLGIDVAATEKGGFEHYMLKEIHEQPDALGNAIRGRLDFNLGTSVLAGMGTSPRELAEIDRVVLLGCGTSLHAGLVGEYAFEDLADVHSEVQQAAEFRYRNPILGSRDLVVAISQSGETADTLAAVREANQKGAFVMSLCNVVGSTIARETGRGVYLHAGPEISVASTKAFTCQVAVLLMMALKLGRGRRFSREDGIRLAREIEALPALVAKVVAQSERIGQIAAEYAKNEHAFFIGRGPMYPVALEGALKLKEISYAAARHSGHCHRLRCARQGQDPRQHRGMLRPRRQGARPRHRGRFCHRRAHARRHLHPALSSAGGHHSRRGRPPTLRLSRRPHPRLRNRPAPQPRQERHRRVTVVGSSDEGCAGDFLLCRQAPGIITLATHESRLPPFPARPRIR